MDVKYPDVKVKLTGEDGNAFSLMGLVSRALRKHGVGDKEISEFTEEAMSGSYEDLLRTCARWVSVR